MKMMKPHVKRTPTPRQTTTRTRTPRTPTATNGSRNKSNATATTASATTNKNSTLRDNKGHPQHNSNNDSHSQHTKSIDLQLQMYNQVYSSNNNSNISNTKKSLGVVGDNNTADTGVSIEDAIRAKLQQYTQMYSQNNSNTVSRSNSKTITKQQHTLNNLSLNTVRNEESLSPSVDKGSPSVAHMLRDEEDSGTDSGAGQGTISDPCSPAYNSSSSSSFIHLAGGATSSTTTCLSSPLSPESPLAALAAHFSSQRRAKIMKKGATTTTTTATVDDDEKTQHLKAAALTATKSSLTDFSSSSSSKRKNASSRTTTVTTTPKQNKTRNSPATSARSGTVAVAVASSSSAAAKAALAVASVTSPPFTATKLFDHRGSSVDNHGGESHQSYLTMAMCATDVKSKSSGVTSKGYGYSETMKNTNRPVPSALQSADINSPLSPPSSSSSLIKLHPTAHAKHHSRSNSHSTSISTNKRKVSGSSTSTRTTPRTPTASSPKREITMMTSNVAAAAPIVPPPPVNGSVPSLTTPTEADRTLLYRYHEEQEVKQAERIRQLQQEAEEAKLSHRLRLYQQHSMSSTSSEPATTATTAGAEEEPVLLAGSQHTSTHNTQYHDETLSCRMQRLLDYFNAKSKSQSNQQSHQPDGHREAQYPDPEPIDESSDDEKTTDAYNGGGGVVVADASAALQSEEADGRVTILAGYIAEHTQLGTMELAGRVKAAATATAASVDSKQRALQSQASSENTHYCVWGQGSAANPGGVGAVGTTVAPPFQGSDDLDLNSRDEMNPVNAQPPYLAVPDVVAAARASAGTSAAAVVVGSSFASSTEESLPDVDVKHRSSLVGGGGTSGLAASGESPSFRSPRMLSGSGVNSLQQSPAEIVRLPATEMYTTTDLLDTQETEAVARAAEETPNVRPSAPRDANVPFPFGKSLSPQGANYPPQSQLSTDRRSSDRRSSDRRILNCWTDDLSPTATMSKQQPVVMSARRRSSVESATRFGFPASPKKEQPAAPMSGRRRLSVQNSTRFGDMSARRRSSVESATRFGFPASPKKEQPAAPMSGRRKLSVQNSTRFGDDEVETTTTAKKKPVVVMSARRRSSVDMARRFDAFPSSEEPSDTSGCRRRSSHRVLNCWTDDDLLTTETGKPAAGAADAEQEEEFYFTATPSPTANPTPASLPAQNARSVSSTLNLNTSSNSATAVGPHNNKLDNSGTVSSKLRSMTTESPLVGGTENGQPAAWAAEAVQRLPYRSATTTPHCSPSRTDSIANASFALEDVKTDAIGMWRVPDATGFLGSDEQKEVEHHRKQPAAKTSIAQNEPQQQPTSAAEESVPTMTSPFVSPRLLQYSNSLERLSARDTAMHEPILSSHLSSDSNTKKRLTPPLALPHDPIPAIKTTTVNSFSRESDYSTGTGYSWECSRSKEEVLTAEE